MIFGTPLWLIKQFGDTNSEIVACKRACFKDEKSISCARPLMRIYFGHKLDTSFFKIKIIMISTQRVRKTSGKERTLIGRKKSTLSVEKDEIVSQKRCGVFPLPKPKETWNNIMKVIQEHWCHSGSFFVYVLTTVGIERIPWELKYYCMGSTENPLLSPPLGLIYFKHIWGGT